MKAFQKVISLLIAILVLGSGILALSGCWISSCNERKEDLAKCKKEIGILKRDADTVGGDALNAYVIIVGCVIRKYDYISGIDFDDLDITEEEYHDLGRRAYASRAKKHVKEAKMFALRGQWNDMLQQFNLADGRFARAEQPPVSSLVRLGAERTCRRSQAVNMWREITESYRNPEFCPKSKYRALIAFILDHGVSPAEVENASTIKFSEIGRMHDVNQDLWIRKQLADIRILADNPKWDLQQGLEEYRSKLKDIGVKPADGGLTSEYVKELKKIHNRAKDLQQAIDGWMEMTDLSNFRNLLTEREKIDLDELLAGKERSIRNQLAKTNRSAHSIGMTEGVLAGVRQEYRDTYATFREMMHHLK